MLGDRVVYVERRTKISLAFFAAAVVSGIVGGLLLPHPVSMSKDPGIAGQFLGMGVMLFVTSMALQHFSRTFIIDAEAGTIDIEERRLLHFTDRRQLPLAGVRVRTTSTPMGSGRCYWIWLDYENRPSTLFLGNIREQRQLQQLVVRLREDLQLPGTVALPPEE